MNTEQSMVGTSLFCRWLTQLRSVLCVFWKNSALGGWVSRRGKDFSRAAASSRTVNVLVRDGALKRGWSNSLFGRLFCAVWNLPVRLFQRIYRLCSGLWDGSLTCRGVFALGRGSAVLVGMFALWMLVSPHEMWNNVFGFLAAVAVFALYCLGCSNRKRVLEVGRLGPYFAFYALFTVFGLVCSLSPALSLRFFLFHMTCFLLTVVTVAAVYACYQGYVGVEVVASQQDLNLNKGMPGRVYSFFDNPNNFAEILTMLMPITLALTLNAETWRGKLCGAVSLALSAVAIALTYSRSSWLGLVLAMIIFLALMNPRFLPAMLVLGLCAIPFLPKTILNRILTIGNMNDSSARYRIAIYEDTANLLRDYGVTGVGLGSDVMQRVFRLYPTLYDGHYPIHTHNNYFQMWGEIGIFGLLAYLGLMFGQIKESLRAFRTADKSLKRILAAALGGLVGLMAISLVEYTWFYPRNMFLFWILFAVIAACVKLIQTPAEAK